MTVDLEFDNFIYRIQERLKFNAAERSGTKTAKIFG